MSWEDCPFSDIITKETGPGKNQDCRYCCLGEVKPDFLRTISTLNECDHRLQIDSFLSASQIQILVLSSNEYIQYKINIFDAGVPGRNVAPLIREIMPLINGRPRRYSIVKILPEPNLCAVEGVDIPYKKNIPVRLRSAMLPVNVQEFC